MVDRAKPAEGRARAEMDGGDLPARLETHVRALATDIGQRSYAEADKLALAAEYIEGRLKASSLQPLRQPFLFEGREYFNISAEAKGESPEVFVVGAHYDTVVGSPGADDNASGVAGMLEIARLAALQPPPLTIRFAAFCLEEPPAFRTSRMGSHVYAETLRKEGAPVAGMVSLEMIGYYSDRPGSQLYPLPLLRWRFPDVGNYIAFVGDLRSKGLTKRMKDAFRRHSALPVESLNTVSAVPGVDFSDHRSFWKFGFRAFMATDTAFYRNPNYHGPGDTAETLDYRRMADAVAGLYGAIGEMRGGAEGV